MLVDINQAADFLADCSQLKWVPTMHPSYVATDAKRVGGEAIYFFHRNGGSVFYYPSIKCQVPGTDYYDIQSAYGYGGPTTNSTDRDFLRMSWNEWRSWCERNSILAEFVRFHPLLDNDQDYPGQVLSDRETVWIDLTQEDLLSTYSTRVRTAVRKSIKMGAAFEIDSSLQYYPQFIRLYRSRMSSLGAKDEYLFSDEYFASAREWPHLSLGVVKYQGEIVSASLFLTQGDYVEYFLSASNEKARESSATHLLLHEAAVSFKKKGYIKFHLGGGTNSLSDNPLYFFKSGFSNNKGSFKIGKNIHLAEPYTEMKERWERETGRKSPLVLFYRS